MVSKKKSQFNYKPLALTLLIVVALFVFLIYILGGRDNGNYKIQRSPQQLQLIEVTCGSTIYKSIVLDKDLNCLSSGLTVGANNVTIDCNGRSIRGPGHTNSGSGVRYSNKNNVIIKNCIISGFAVGIASGRPNEGGIGNEFINNGIFGNGAGITVYGAMNPTFQNNIIEQNILGQPGHPNVGLYISGENILLLGNRMCGNVEDISCGTSTINPSSNNPMSNTAGVVNCANLLTVNC